MVSLLTLSEVMEQGVKFRSPHDGQETLLTPEYSIQLQNIIGADIIMQLDDVVSSKLTGGSVGGWGDSTSFSTSYSPQARESRRPCTAPFAGWTAALL